VSKKSKDVVTYHRSAKTGQFVSANYAKRHPATTVKESVTSSGKGKIITSVSDSVPVPEKKKRAKK
jgi:hypothetical protein